MKCVLTENQIMIRLRPFVEIAHSHSRKTIPRQTLNNIDILLSSFYILSEYFGRIRIGIRVD